MRQKVIIIILALIPVVFKAFALVPGVRFITHIRI